MFFWCERTGYIKNDDDEMSDTNISDDPEKINFQDPLVAEVLDNNNQIPMINNHNSSSSSSLVIEQHKFKVIKAVLTNTYLIRSIFSWSNRNFNFNNILEKRNHSLLSEQQQQQQQQQHSSSSGYNNNDAFEQQDQLRNHLLNIRHGLNKHLYSDWIYLRDILDNKYYALLKDKLKTNRHLVVAQRDIVRATKLIGDFETFKLLYTRYQDLYTSDKLLKYACSQGNIDIISLLLAQTNPVKLSTANCFAGAVSKSHIHVLDHLYNNNVQMFDQENLTTISDIKNAQSQLIKGILKSGSHAVKIWVAARFPSISLNTDTTINRGLRQSQQNDLSNKELAYRIRFGEVLFAKKPTSVEGWFYFLEELSRLKQGHRLAFIRDLLIDRPPAWVGREHPKYYLDLVYQSTVNLLSKSKSPFITFDSTDAHNKYVNMENGVGYFIGTPHSPIDVKPVGRTIEYIISSAYFAHPFSVTTHVEHIMAAHRYSHKDQLNLLKILYGIGVVKPTESTTDQDQVQIFQKLLRAAMTSHNTDLIDRLLQLYQNTRINLHLCDEPGMVRYVIESAISRIDIAPSSGIEKIGRKGSIELFDLVVPTLNNENVRIILNVASQYGRLELVKHIESQFQNAQDSSSNSTCYRPSVWTKNIHPSVFYYCLEHRLEGWTIENAVLQLVINGRINRIMVVTTQQIEDKLRATYADATIKVEDVSGGCGAKFDIIIGSDVFDGVALLQRHRMVNETMGDLMKTNVGPTQLYSTQQHTYILLFILSSSYSSFLFSNQNHSVPFFSHPSIHF
ncbi:hypothetical protein DFA_11566 [Cavenderia fasciculata]|uniref:Ankyrin repeat-containing protein n=1 Tax=Cavenderia fasciculata TaxID=261658 RepID=F4QDK8_CACFS|nr:uncharacterized protein DFA_11566 [Cavenderia fasciculata]EGG13805.1 hypothetical protein DFA_11566 [Cavenderia fasciculata]|eukprot:XP_004350513.1 hypothetical protein DFA_11566 [Cavenderia fasciculata]